MYAVLEPSMQNFQQIYFWCAAIICWKFSRKRSARHLSAIPVDAWKQVLSWIKDLTVALRKRSGDRDTLFIL